MTTAVDLGRKATEKNKRNYRENGKKCGSHNMTVLYPNLCYNQLCLEGAALYLLSFVCPKK